MNPKDNLPPTNVSSYQRTLLLSTRGGAITATCFFLFFSFYYGASDYPVQVMWFQISATVICATAILFSYTKRTRFAAQLVTLALFISLVGPGLYTGGIDSSQLVWLAFVPVAATVMGGIYSGLFWGSASIATVIGLFLLNRVFMIDLTARPPQSMDRLVELVFCIAAVGSAILLSERIKRQHMVSLDSAKVQLTNLANMDPLTNVFNRRYFIDQAQTHLKRDGEGREFSLLLIDIDHFKKVNDTFGHIVGDLVLNSIVSICASVLRKNDILARLGGEEFIVLLPDTSLKTTMDIAERLRMVVQDTPIGTETGTIHVTVSIGVSSYLPSDIISLPELIRQADDAMYEAKDAGRNRVIAWV